MSTAIDIDALVLTKGTHASPEDGLCVMELAAILADRPHSAYLLCVCPTLSIFLRNWNDALDDVTRQRLKPYAARIIGTAGDGNADRRAWMCLDWLLHESVPAFLEISGLKTEADNLRTLPEIQGPKSLLLANPAIKAASGASRVIVGSAPPFPSLNWDFNPDCGPAARAAVWAALWSAAVVDAAWEITLAVVLYPVQAAALDGTTLEPLVSRLQESAFLLLDRMCDLRSAARAPHVGDRQLMIRRAFLSLFALPLCAENPLRPGWFQHGGRFVYAPRRLWLAVVERYFDGWYARAWGDDGEHGGTPIITRCATREEAMASVERRFRRDK